MTGTEGGGGKERGGGLDEQRRPSSKIKKQRTGRTETRAATVCTEGEDAGREQTNAHTAQRDRRHDGMPVPGETRRSRESRRWGADDGVDGRRVSQGRLSEGGEEDAPKTGMAACGSASNRGGLAREEKQCSIDDLFQFERNFTARCDANLRPCHVASVHVAPPTCSGA